MIRRGRVTWFVGRFARPSSDRKSKMTSEEFVRQAYATAEVKDIAAWVGCSSPDGVFVEESVGVTYAVLQQHASV
jgi:hypothetical protein